MVTRCPGCNTVFRVTPQQLQARQGKVRCGRCMLVFDGFKALAAMPYQPAGDLQGPMLESGTVPAQPAAEPAASTTDSAAITAGITTTPQSYALDDGLQIEPAPAGRQRGVLWAACSVLLLLALAAQAAYFYRTELASTYPGLKPILTRACGMLGCSVPLPQRPRLIKVEASDLQIVDSARPTVVQLTVTLRNHAGYDLAYPALDLVLTNTSEHTLARRIFLPGEYLERGKNAGSGIPANAEITLRLDLDTGDLGAAGFRLDLLPAPAR